MDAVQVHHILFHCTLTVWGFFFILIAETSTTYSRNTFIHIKEETVLEFQSSRLSTATFHDVFPPSNLTSWARMGVMLIQLRLKKLINWAQLAKQREIRSQHPAAGYKYPDNIFFFLNALLVYT